MMKKSIKIAIITSGYLPVPASKGGAVENLVQNLLDENEKNKNIKFIVYSIEDNEAQEIAKKTYKNSEFIFVKANIFVRYLDKFIYWIAKNIFKKQNTISYRYILQRLCFLNKVSKNLNRNDYDKVILENHSSLFLALKWRKNYYKYAGKYYYHVHNEIKQGYGCDDIIKNSKSILCVSDYIRKQVKEILNIDGNILTVLKNGIDTDKFNGTIDEKTAKDLRNKYKIKHDEKVIIFTGRINEQKGIKQLLQAISNMNYSKFKLLVVGGYFFNTNIKSNFEKEIEPLIEKVKDNVIFTGYVDYEELHNIYAISDIAVLPSMWEEPCALTVIESMASGLPIIATDSGGIPEYVNENMSVIIKRDKYLVKNLRIAIDELISNDEKIKEMSKEAKKQARLFSKSEYYKNFMDRIK